MTGGDGLLQEGGGQEDKQGAKGEGGGRPGEQSVFVSISLCWPETFEYYLS